MVSLLLLAGLELIVVYNSFQKSLGTESTGFVRIQFPVEGTMALTNPVGYSTPSGDD